MAKSLRSKWRRKCRAVKRERYGEKELLRLKKTLGVDGKPSTSSDVNMTEMSEIATVTTAETIKKSKKNLVKQAETMESDDKLLQFNTKTLRNAHGAYPIWLHPRKIQKKNKKAKKGKVNKNNKNKK